MTDTVAGKGVLKPAAETPALGKASPEELLKQAVGGGGKAATDGRRPWLRDLDLRLTAVATVALLAGAALGVLAVPRDGGADALARLGAEVEAGRRDATRLDGQIEGLTRAVTQMREAADAVRADGRSHAADVSKRFDRMERGVEAKLTSLGESLNQAERETGSRLASLTVQIEKRAAQPTVSTVAAPPPVAEPVRTGSIGEKVKLEPNRSEPSRPDADKPAPVDAWALRDVYDGVAMLEDRKRRLVEVAPGDHVPGIGRVEAIERRGRNWVVVTKLGIITSQSW